MRQTLPITDREVELPRDINILSTTDPKSYITYINPDFIQISGFSEAELLGQPHNIVRHPHMPSAAFADMWATLKSGRSWMGLIKNRCKNGDHYWVNAYATPIVQDGVTVEYQSVRTKPEPQHVRAAEALYAQLRAGKALKKPWLQLSLSLRLILQIWAALLLVAVATSFVVALPLTGLLTMTLLTGVLSSLAIAVRLAPLKALTERARAIADNPLSQSVYTGRQDELGAIEFALRMLQSETGALVGRMADASNKLGGFAQKLLEEIESSNRATGEQQARTEQIAAAVTQMAASVQEVAHNAHQAADAASKADHETLMGQALVTDTRDAITELEGAIGRAAAVIHELEGQSKEISKVLDVIRGIAEQTNLLALNAAIEAARAGEQGRGFAVVADEVRSLAARTQKSTTDIQGMISALQERARTAVMAMEQSGAQANSSVAHALQAANALNGISQRVNDITDRSAQIATAVEEQGAVSDDIHRSISQIRDTATRNVELGHNTENSAASVSRLSSDLSVLARQFWEKRS